MTAMVDDKEMPLTRDGAFWVLELPARPSDRPTVINFR
jgi:hypothetical protein